MASAVKMESTASAPSRRPDASRVVIYGYYGSRNLGDDLLLLVVLDRLRQLMRGARFQVRDHGHLAELAFCGDDVTPAPIERLLADPDRMKPLRYWDYMVAWRRLLRDADWLIVGGGTVFHAHGSIRPLLLQSLIFRMARYYGVRLVALGVGVSELPDARSRRLLSGIIRGFVAFLVRDAAGLRQCAGTKAEPSGDLVFACRDISAGATDMDDTCGTSPTVGLTVSPPACADDAIIEALREFVRRLQTAGHPVVFLVFQRSGHVPGDETVFARISAGLDQSQRPEIRVLSAAPRDLATALADIGIVTGMRFHGLVLATMLGRPFVGLAHDNKISDLCQRMGMPWIDPATTDLADAIVSATLAASKLRPDPAAVAMERDNAEINFRRLAGIVGGKRGPPCATAT